MTISDASHVERTRGLNIVKLYKGILTKIDLEKVVSERKALTKEFNKFFFVDDQLGQSSAGSRWISTFFRTILYTFNVGMREIKC